jgi:hypothetical protein
MEPKPKQSLPKYDLKIVKTEEPFESGRMIITLKEDIWSFFSECKIPAGTKIAMPYSKNKVGTWTDFGVSSQIHPIDITKPVYCFHSGYVCYTDCYKKASTSFDCADWIGPLFKAGYYKNSCGAIFGDCFEDACLDPMVDPSANTVKQLADVLVARLDTIEWYYGENEEEEEDF